MLVTALVKHKSFDINTVIVHYGGMIRSQKGFSAIEGLIIVFVAGLIGVAAGLVWHSHYHSHTLTNTKQKTYTDAAGTYRLQYPATWTINQVASGDPTDLDQSNPEFLPDKGPELPCNAVSCGPHHVAGMDVKAVKVKKADDILKLGWYPVKNETINGYQSYFKQESPSKAVTDYYFVFHNGVLLEFSFSPISADGFGDTTNNSQQTPSFVAIIHTVKFLK
jgi:hypothetical protein